MSSAAWSSRKQAFNPALQNGILNVPNPLFTRANYEEGWPELYLVPVAAEFHDHLIHQNSCGHLQPERPAHAVAQNKKWSRHIYKNHPNQPHHQDKIPICSCCYFLAA